MGFGKNLIYLDGCRHCNKNVQKLRDNCLKINITIERTIKKNK